MGGWIPVFWLRWLEHSSGSPHSSLILNLVFKLSSLCQYTNLYVGNCLPFRSQLWRHCRSHLQWSLDRMGYHRQPERASLLAIRKSVDSDQRQSTQQILTHDIYTQRPLGHFDPLRLILTVFNCRCLLSRSINWLYNYSRYEIRDHITRSKNKRGKTKNKKKMERGL